jgi:hypothetical protein
MTAGITYSHDMDHIEERQHNRKLSAMPGHSRQQPTTLGETRQLLVIPGNSR